MSGVVINLHFAFALEGGDFISSLSDSIDSIRRSEEVDGVRLSYILPLMLPIKKFLKTMG
jgi:hypothetical protein